LESQFSVRSHHMPPEFRLRSHCQASWRHASPPNTPVSCRSDSRPSFWSKLEALPRSSQQPMDWPATQGQQQHATSWPVEKIHHTWSYGSDATVLDDYALMMNAVIHILLLALTSHRVDRAFAVTGPRACNGLLQFIMDCSSPLTFKIYPTTYLFSLSFWSVNQISDCVKCRCSSLGRLWHSVIQLSVYVTCVVMICLTVCWSIMTGCCAVHKG